MLNFFSWLRLSTELATVFNFSIGGSDFFKRMEPWALIRYLQKKIYIVEILFETKYLKKNIGHD